MSIPGKKALRQEIAERLAGLGDPDYQRLNRRIQQCFFELQPVREARVIMIYHSIKREVATLPIIETLIRQGKQVALPVCTPERDLEARLIQSLTEVIDTGKFGLKEPRQDAPTVAIADLDLIVLPGVAFDNTGNRLGHGMGYYDRFLARIDPRVFKLALAYDFQVVSQVPAETHDIKMDAILTPEHFWLCNGSPKS
ncbi:MAG TPA: 5-formyltetrahydrofolate cyclo-ligase [Bacillota bacterium]|nr:5-formyltetrahydrofolate cyclo-ligase [Bacillota bacterium]